MIRGTAVALAAATLGAVLASVFALPAPALVGATLLTTAAALLGPRVGLPAPTIPRWLRDIAFAVIGMTLGAGVTPSILHDFVRWAPSLLAMLGALGASTIVAMLVLRRFFPVDPATALLATAPGALSYAVALALEGRGDARTVTVLQGVRLFAITVLVPPLVVGFGGAVALTPVPVTPLGTSAVVLAVAGLAAITLSHLKVPAAWLVAGLVVSGAAHAVGLVEGRASDPVLAAGFTVAGGVIGARFAGFGPEELRRLALEGTVVSLVAIGLSALFSLGAASWFGLPFGQVWVAYAPGGVEGMAAIAVSLGYDPVFVATHHIVRLFALIVVLPIVAR